jgi:hypothetical protein
MRTFIVVTLALGLGPLALTGCESGRRGRNLDIAERQDVQREHIREGVREGELTPREAQRLRERSAGVAEQRRDAREDDGRVDARERRQIRREQNQLGDDIYRQRHDDDER